MRRRQPRIVSINFLCRIFLEFLFVSAICLCSCLNLHWYIFCKCYKLSHIITAELEECKKGGFLSEDRIPITKLTRAGNLKQKNFWAYRNTLFRCNFLFPQNHFQPRHQIKQITSRVILFQERTTHKLFGLMPSLGRFLFHNNKYFIIHDFVIYSLHFYRLIWG